MEFYEEADFDREQYEAYLRRIHYDDRDAVMYENMLSFLWKYIISGQLDDRSGLLEEYSHWNLQLIDKVYYKAHDLPYAELRRAYQSFVCLLHGDWKEGLRQLHSIRESAFAYDGFAPKSIMVASGKVYNPCSRLFLLYNYDKYFAKHGLTEERDALREKYTFAFRFFGDAEHEKHDAFLRHQLEEHSEQLYYPVFDRVYKLPRGPKDFFIYYEEDQYILL